MRTNILRVTCVVLALFISSVSAQTEPIAVTRLAPDEFAWVPTPVGGQRVSCGP